MVSIRSMSTKAAHGIAVAAKATVDADLAFVPKKVKSGTLRAVDATHDKVVEVKAARKQLKAIKSLTEAVEAAQSVQS